MPISKKTIIFFPLEMGLAHITRSLAIAEEAQRRGHRVLFALSKRKQHLIKNKKIKIVTVKEFLPDEASTEKAKDPNYISLFIPEELRLLQELKPDIAVNDLRLSAIASCKMLNIPTCFIGNTDALPFKFQLPNANLPKLIYKAVLPVIQSSVTAFKSCYFRSLIKAAKKFGYKINMKELLNMRYIIPETEGYLSLKEKNPNINYVGPISWKGFEKIIPPWISKIKPNGKTIYLTFGGTGYDGPKLLALSKLLIERGYRVLVSSSNIIKEKAFKKLPNLYVEKYLPGQKICRLVDLLVCHGGIGTMMQALRAGIPVVTVPFNPDQYLHSLRFQELGLASCVTKINILDLFKINWNIFQEKGRLISAEKIAKTIDKVLAYRDTFAKRVNQFRERLPRIDAAKKAVDIIEIYER